MKKVMIVFGLLCVAIVLALMQSEESLTVASDKKMIEVGKPLQITVTGQVGNLAWSKKGDTLFYVRRDGKPLEVRVQSAEGEEPEKSEAVWVELCAYDGKRSSVLKRILSPFADDDGVFDAAEFAMQYHHLPDRRALLLSYTSLTPIDNTPHPLFRLNSTVEIFPISRSEAVIPLYSSEKTYYMIDVSPKGDIAIVFSESEQNSYTELLDLKTLNRKKVVTGRHFFFHWHKEGHSFYYVNWENRPVVRYRYELSSGKSVEVSAQEIKDNPKKYPQMETPALKLSSSKESSHPSHPIYPIYLNSLKTPVERYKSVLIAFDAVFEEDSKLCALSPAENGVAYVNWRGQLFVVPLTKRDPKDVREKLACGAPVSEEEQQEYYLQNAKQIGTAIQMYAQDYDEYYPLNFNASDALMPYLKDGDAFKSLSGTLVFRYLGNGEHSSKVSPEGMVGYLDIGGSMVVGIYGDGSARVAPRPK